MSKALSLSTTKEQSSGQPFKTKENNKVKISYNIGKSLARLVPRLVSQAKNTIRDLDSHNDLKFMRLKTSKNEILIAPDNEFILIVVQGQKA
jgi:dynein light chain roadblock-type